WLKQNAYEKAQQMMMEEASQYAIKNSPIDKEQVDFFISGDLINQITPTTFAANSVGTPYLGLFSACATSMEGLALAAFIINGKGRSEEHTSELQSRFDLVCRLLLEKKKVNID